jgi:SAM-dependent methyltransferase
MIRKTIKKIGQSLTKNLYLYTGAYFQFSLPTLKYFKLKKNLRLLEKQAKVSTAKFPVTKLYPCYEDQNDDAGILSFHYFFQDLYIAQRIFQNNPKRHVDIGSRIDGFVTHVASYREIEVYDIRPMEISIPNVKFIQADLMNLSETDYSCTDSISCLHALEHFGLGRYGDEICFDGYLLGFQNIYKMLQKGGKFYFSVPMGNQRIEFHAHRVFSIRYLLEIITPHYTIDTFSYIDDQNRLCKDVSISEENLSNNFNCQFGCAIFELTKK